MTAIGVTATPSPRSSTTGAEARGCARTSAPTRRSRSPAPPPKPRAGRRAAGSGCSPWATSGRRSGSSMRITKALPARRRQGRGASVCCAASASSTRRRRRTIPRDRSTPRSAGPWRTAIAWWSSRRLPSRRWRPTSDSAPWPGARTCCVGRCTGWPRSASTSCCAGAAGDPWPRPPYTPPCARWRTMRQRSGGRLGRCRPAPERASRG